MNKPIARVIFRRKKNVKNYIFKLDDGSVQIESLFLVDKDCDVGEVLCTKFNKSLYMRSGRYSRETLEVMLQIATRDLEGSYRLSPNK